MISIAPGALKCEEQASIGSLKFHRKLFWANGLTKKGTTSWKRDKKNIFWRFLAFQLFLGATQKSRKKKTPIYETANFLDLYRMYQWPWAWKMSILEHRPSVMPIPYSWLIPSGILLPLLSTTLSSHLKEKRSSIWLTLRTGSQWKAAHPNPLPLNT